MSFATISCEVRMDKLGELLNAVAPLVTSDVSVTLPYKEKELSVVAPAASEASSGVPTVASPVVEAPVAEAAGPKGAPKPPSKPKPADGGKDKKKPGPKKRVSPFTDEQVLEAVKSAGSGGSVMSKLVESLKTHPRNGTLLRESLKRLVAARQVLRTGKKPRCAYVHNFAAPTLVAPSKSNGVSSTSAAVPATAYASSLA